ncbi:MAG: RNA methyltransferase [Parcubacteria group bacterium]|nr:RNA methyltransferase [Parcubacteria group bacterium]
MKIRNKNAILELLKEDVAFDKISVVEGLDQDEMTKEILSVASKRGVSIETKPLSSMARRRTGSTHEVIVGFLSPIHIWKFDELLENLYQSNRTPFFLLINKVEFASNVGIIARTAFAAGVTGLIFQGDEHQFLNEDTVHFSTGAIARVPLVKMGVFEAMEQLQKNGIPTYALHMGGVEYSSEDLRGPAAFVLGAEGEGLSDTVLKRCDKKLSIPMREGIDSLNVGTSAAILLFEKVRQEGGDFLGKQ